MSFAIASPPATATLILGAIILGCIAITTQLFLSEASETSLTWTLRGSGALTLALSGVIIYFLWGSYRSTVTVDDGTLRLRVPMYSTTVPLDIVVAAQVTIVDLAANHQLRPSIRTNALGIPGYRLGRFRLENGTRARVALTRRSDAVYVPTIVGTALLISVDRPEKFIAALRNAAAS